MKVEYDVEMPMYSGKRYNHEVVFNEFCNSGKEFACIDFEGNIIQAKYFVNSVSLMRDRKRITNIFINRRKSKVYLQRVNEQ